MQPPPVSPAPPFFKRLLGVLTRPAGAGFLLLLAGFAAYGGALQGEFLWDDTFLVERNPFIRSPVLLGEAFRHFLFHDSAATFYRPVQTLSYAGDYALWGLDPYGYRLTNLVLHLLAGWGLYGLARRLLTKFLHGPADAPALGLALLWLVHPVHNAAVAYVAGRADTLAAGFALLAWWLYETVNDGERAVRRPLRILGNIGAAVALLLALFSKEMAAIWVALFALRLACVADGKSRCARALALGAAVACLGLYAVARGTLPSTPPGLTAPGAPTGLPPRALLAARALGDYGGLLGFPDRLCMERQVFAAYGPDYNPELADYYRSLTFAGPVFLLLLLGAGFWPGPARRLRAFGAAWFLVAFLPVSNLFTLNASVAEHWLYVPSVGVGLLLVGLLACLKPRARGAVTVLLFAVALPALVWRTARRAEDWTTRVRFVPRTIADGGDSPRMRNMLASLLAARGDLAGGERLLRGLVERSPSNATAALNLANNLRQQGRPAEAGALLAGIVAHPPAADPRPLPLALNALDELDAAGQFPWPGAAGIGEALDDALRRCPQSWDLLLLRVNRLARQENRPEEAIRRLEEYLRVCPWNYAAWMRLAEGRNSAGDADGTLAAYVRAGRLDTRETQSWLRRAILLNGLGRTEEAREALKVARGRGSNLAGK